jgi:hypothetical protein
MADWPQGCMPGTDFANSMLANRRSRLELKMEYLKELARLEHMRSMVSRKFDTVECCSVIGLPK